MGQLYDQIGSGYARRRRPHAYLNREVRNAISAFARIAGVEEGLTRLAQDLADGSWQHRYGHLLHQEEADLGYRIVVSGQAMRQRHLSGDCQGDCTPRGPYMVYRP